MSTEDVVGVAAVAGAIAEGVVASEETPCDGASGSTGVVAAALRVAACVTAADAVSTVVAMAAASVIGNAAALAVAATGAAARAAGAGVCNAVCGPACPFNANMRKQAMMKPACSSGARESSLRLCTATE